MCPSSLHGGAFSGILASNIEPIKVLRMSAKEVSALYRSPYPAYAIAISIALLFTGYAAYNIITILSPTFFDSKEERVLTPEEALELYKNPKKRMSPQERLDKYEEIINERYGENGEKKQVEVEKDYTDSAVAINETVSAFKVFSIDEYSTSSLFWRMDKFTEDIMNISSAYLAGAWETATASDELTDKEKFDAYFEAEEAKRKAKLNQ